MKCSIEECGDQQTNCYRFVSPYCAGHDRLFRDEFGFCNFGEVGREDADNEECYNTHPKAPGIHFCAKHGGSDYVPRTGKEAPTP